MQICETTLSSTKIVFQMRYDASGCIMKWIMSGTDINIFRNACIKVIYGRPPCFAWNWNSLSHLNYHVTVSKCKRFCSYLRLLLEGSQGRCSWMWPGGATGLVLRNWLGGGSKYERGESPDLAVTACRSFRRCSQGLTLASRCKSWN